MSSTSSLHSRNTSEPSCVTDAPSTKCAGSGTEMRWPVSSERFSRSAPSASTPITCEDAATHATGAMGDVRTPRRERRTRARAPLYPLAAPYSIFHGPS
eukprot:3537760-Prymnesium_polylepis.1